ncbi:GDP-mannose mannosyl hydrolase [Leclercia sp.]|uniref:GDP-mannose mannosyl hydrolase n=1 Tax=Leclercia sp. TaxID=1898428 RepID=UPI002FDD1FE4
MYLPDDDFKKIIQSSPLISIDLLVKNECNEFLFGERVNQPAKGYWFVPGGRILKDETIEQAMQRISLNELGVTLPLQLAKHYGVWEHFYPDNFFNDEFTTHYIVLAYIVNVIKQDINPPKTQHQNFKWLRREQILVDSTVHNYSTSYFLNDAIVTAIG